MLDSLITSKTRIKLLTRLFLNSNSYGHLRGLQTEFGESSNAIRLELNRFEQAGLIISHTEANRKVYSANTSHPLFPEINSILHKHLGLDLLIEKVIERGGIAYAREKMVEYRQRSLDILQTFHTYPCIYLRVFNALTTILRLYISQVCSCLRQMCRITVPQIV